MVIKCRFCGTPAIMKVGLDRGCACYPDDREQWLCAQHVYKVEPIGSMIELEYADYADTSTP